MNEKQKEKNEKLKKELLLDDLKHRTKFDCSSLINGS